MNQENEVLLGLGANLGDPVAQLAQAVRALEEVMRVTAVSSLWRSEPVGYADQPEFYNLVVRGWTTREPLDLLRAMREIEERMGRRRSFANAPRTMDIDLLACEDRVMRTDELTLPHPRLHLRGFVLHPLLQVAPDWTHPVLRRTARELLSLAQGLERVERAGALPGWGGPLAPAPSPG